MSTLLRVHSVFSSICALSVFLLARPMPAAAASPVHHLVLFQFKDDAPVDQVQGFLHTLSALPWRIPGITGLQAGANNSPEGLSQGFTHGAIMTFNDVSARDAYAQHSDHEALVKVAEPILKEAFVFDFEVPSPPPPAELGRVHHLVFFKFKEKADSEPVKKLLENFAALPKKISGLLHYQAGPNIDPQARSKDLTHGFLLTFINDRARDDYIEHPAHREFVDQIKPGLDGVLVVDFTVTPSGGGLFITGGIEPFAVYQRSEKGTADLKFHGVAPAGGPIEARLLKGRRLVEGFDWMVVGQARGGAFEASLAGVPAGGEYTVEVRQKDRLGNVAAHADVSGILVGDIWILAGQSNMEGVGDLANVEEPSPLVHNFTMAHRWELATEPLHWLIDSPDPVHSGNGLKDLDESGRRQRRAAARANRRKGSGLGLAFAKELSRRTGVPIGLVSAAHGGTSMTQWDPAGRDKGGETLYGSMFKQVKNAGGKVKGVLWYQGESDANPEAVEKFAERFRGLVAAFRGDIGPKDLPFYSVQIGRYVSPNAPENWNRIQDLQRLAAKEIPGTAVVSVIDLELDDAIHVGVEGLKRAGRRLAKIAHRELFGAKSIERGPQPESIKAEAGGRAIRIQLSGVNRRLLPAAPGQVDGFSIRKKDGTVLPLIFNAQVDPAAPAAVVLKLNAAVPEDAFLHYGAGLDPTCNLVDDEDMAAPVFGPAAIAR